MCAKFCVVHCVQRIVLPFCCFSSIFLFPLRLTSVFFDLSPVSFFSEGLPYEITQTRVRLKKVKSALLRQVMRCALCAENCPSFLFFFIYFPIPAPFDIRFLRSFARIFLFIRTTICDNADTR